MAFRVAVHRAGRRHCLGRRRMPGDFWRL